MFGENHSFSGSSDDISQASSNFLFDINGLLSDDEDESSSAGDDSSLGGILQQVLDIEATLCGEDDSDEYDDDDDEDDDLPPELDVRFDSTMMEPELNVKPQKDHDEGYKPSLCPAVDWQQRLLQMEQEEECMRRTRPQLAAE
mmetsp:Transcript_24214/g.35878  ORF Transcript_24214/g.35878 Transcript_24214/m.35878 type:complete len:143 (-) Transcript_24214:55-483(-)